MTYTLKESSEQVELEFLSKRIGYCMKNERFGPDSDRHSDRRLSLPAQRQLESLLFGEEGREVLKEIDFSCLWAGKESRRSE